MILFDKRGTGLSDRVGGAADTRAAHGRRACGDGRGGFARGGAAGRLRGRPDVQPLRDDVSGADPRARDDRHVRQAAVGARLPVGAGRGGARSVPRRDPRPTGAGRWASRPARRAVPPIRRSASWWSNYLRQGASPGAALTLTQMNAEIDVRDVLPLVRVPTLVVHRTGDRCLLVEEGRYVAGLIPGAQFVELPGDDHLPFVGDQDAIVDEIAAFVTSADRGAAPDRVLATVLCAAHRRRAGRTARRRGFETHVQQEIAWFRGGA